MLHFVDTSSFTTALCYWLIYIYSMGFSSFIDIYIVFFWSGMLFVWQPRTKWIKSNKNIVHKYKVKKQKQRNMHNTTQTSRNSEKVTRTIPNKGKKGMENTGNIIRVPEHDKYRPKGLDIFWKSYTLILFHRTTRSKKPRDTKKVLNIKEKIQ